MDKEDMADEETNIADCRILSPENKPKQNNQYETGKNKSRPTKGIGTQRNA